MDIVSEYQQHLLRALTSLDRLATETEELLAAPADVDVGVRAEELRELVVEMEALVQQKLDFLGTIRADV